MCMYVCIYIYIYCYCTPEMQSGNAIQAKGIVDGGEVRRDAHGDCMKIFCREKYKVAENAT